MEVAPVTDTIDRPLQDLRISVTDRCNFRCVYCMPREIFGSGYQFLAREDLLSFEEIIRLAKLFVGLGVRKIRLTGGEPLLRRNIEHLIEMLAGIPDLEDLTLTTNGTLLPEKAERLKQAGLRRLTVSLDSLDDAVFAALNDIDFPVQKVLDGIEQASRVGLSPIKINMVVKRGLNEADVIPMARHFKDSGHILRFIEFMDVGSSNGWRLDDVVPSSEIVEKIHREMPIEPVDPNYRGEVANRYRYVDGGGEIGLISSVTQPFCTNCTRVRLSAEGKLFTCLFAIYGHDLRKMLRDEETDEMISNVIGSIWQNRGDRYSEIRSAETVDLPKVEMSYIGG